MLGFTISEHAPTESDDCTARVEDREHHPVAEAVIALAFVALNHEAAFDQSLVFVLWEGFLETLPTVRGVADAKTRRDFAGEPAALERSEEHTSELQSLAY